MIRDVYPTDAGMHAVWDQAAFAGVNDYDSWSRELLDEADITRHITAGDLVPLNIGSDGAMEIEVRVGTAAAPASLTARESSYLVVGSQPYLLRSKGKIGVSGLECIAVPPGDYAGMFELKPGDYAVTVHLIAWDEEPGMQTDAGPAPGALPDYVVLVNPADGPTTFRQQSKTFD